MSSSTVRVTVPATLAEVAFKEYSPAVEIAVFGLQVTVFEASFAVEAREPHSKSTPSPSSGAYDNPVTAPVIATLSPFVIVTVIESVFANDFFFKSEAIFAVASQFEKDINDIINIMYIIFIFIFNFFYASFTILDSIFYR